MNRLKAPNSVPFGSRDVAPVSGTPQYATDGNPGVTAQTVWPAYAWNMVQDEVCRVITDAGMVLDDTDWTQLAQAIAILAARGEVMATSSGNFVVPAGKTKVIVEGWGGGGAGASGGPDGTNYDGGGGGQGGGYFRKLLTGLTPGATISYTVGAGGAAPVSTSGTGSNGGDTTIAAYSLTAHGGAAGGIGASGSRGAGGSNAGTASGGDINLTGEYGLAGILLSTAGAVGSPGGNGGRGAGPYGGCGGLGGTGAAGAAGQAPGGGGGGGDDVASGGGLGGAGAGGAVRFSW